MPRKKRAASIVTTWMIAFCISPGFEGLLHFALNLVCIVVQERASCVLNYLNLRSPPHRLVCRFFHTLENFLEFRFHVVAINRDIDNMQQKGGGNIVASGESNRMVSKFPVKMCYNFYNRRKNSENANFYLIFYAADDDWQTSQNVSKSPFLCNSLWTVWRHKLHEKFHIYFLLFNFRIFRL